jgi:hypothetical protein
MFFAAIKILSPKRFYPLLKLLPGRPYLSQERMLKGICRRFVLGDIAVLPALARQCAVAPLDDLGNFTVILPLCYQKMITLPLNIV